jgi:hypothetical protein
MIKTVKQISFGRISMTFQAEVKVNTAPKIIEHEFINGVKHYICEGGRIFIAAIYDRLWNVERQKIHPENYKGENPKHKHLF